METKNLKKTALLAAIMVVIALMLVGSATYAWFTFNSRVSTDRITAKTSSGSVNLLLSATKDPFNGKEECDIVQVNSYNKENLLPVSTSDLVTFVYNNGSKVTDENSYFHGRLYVKASGEGTLQTGMAIYLDNSNELFTNDTDDMLLNAARIGLKFEDKDPVIISLSESHNPSGQQVDNTILNGSLVSSGKPLHMDSNGTVTQVNDPAVSAAAIGIKDNASAKPLAILEIGKIYQLDIFFYLEGTDPDCSESLALDGATIQLAFYGALTE